MGSKRRPVIVFDLGNTLIRFDHSISARKIAKLFDLEEKRIYDLFFDSPLTRAFEKGDISPREFHKRASQLLGVKLPYRDFVRIWADIFWEDKEVCALARRLKKRGYRLFLLSNINRIHFDHIRKKFGIIGIFDELVLSYAIGAMKPERTIYKHAIRKAGGDKTRLIYIDDRNDLIEEAIKLGIPSLKFEGIRKLKADLRNRGIEV